MKNNILTLIEQTSITGYGPIVNVSGNKFTVQIDGITSSGTGGSDVVIYGCNSPSPGLDSQWNELGTISLSLTTTGDSGSFGVVIPWNKVRARIASISGTGAKVSAYICEAK